MAPTDCIWRIGVGLGTVVGAGPSARREEDVLLFFCCDSHHLGHCSGPLLPLGVRLYEPVNAGFAAPCSKDPLHHPWCEDHCCLAVGHGGAVVPTDCIWRIGVGLGTVAGAGPSARREEDVLLFFCYDSHHLGHCSGPLLHVGVRLYEPVNAAFATPCSEDPLHHPWCEDQCGSAAGYVGAGGGWGGWRRPIAFGG